MNCWHLHWLNRASKTRTGQHCQGKLSWTVTKQLNTGQGRTNHGHVNLNWEKKSPNYRNKFWQQNQPQSSNSICQLWGEGWKIPQSATAQFKGNPWPSSFRNDPIKQLYSLSMRQASTCGRVPTWARLQVPQNSGSRMFIIRVKPLSVRDRNWRIREKESCREGSNIKARVSMHWRVQCHAKRPRGQ